MRTSVSQTLKRGNVTETEIHDVNQEVVSPAVGEVSKEDYAPIQTEEGQSRQEENNASDKELNFRAIRESNYKLQAQLEEERQKREELQRAIEEKFANHLKAQEPDEEDELADISDDDWLTRKHAEKVAERRSKVIVKQMLEEERQNRAKEELPNRLKSQFPDFESVVTKENLEYLKANKPHIALSLAANKDPYAQALAAYDAVKAFCPSTQIREEEQRMNANSQKPGTLGNAKAPSPLSEAKMFERGLTPDLKKKLQQEMISAMRGS